MPASLPVECVGRLDIPAAVYQHRNLFEASAAVSVIEDNLERVIGTKNRGAPSSQLYGWGANVVPHQDNLGFVYLMPLRLRHSCLGVESLVGDPSPWRVTTWLRLGRVYRLNDFHCHWTRDSAPVVCLFAGVFKVADDDGALAMLGDGLADLAADKYEAPRVKDGFRALGDHEVYTHGPDGNPVMMLLEEARARGELILQCAVCEERAVLIDHHYPYFLAGNRCYRHLGE